MTAMPRCIQVSLIGFFFAFVCEACVEIAIVRSSSLPWEGYMAVIASLVANPSALAYAVRRKKRGYDLLKWIGAFSLVWTLYGNTSLHALGLWAIATITLCVWVRLGALLALRHKAAKEWIEANTTGSGLRSIKGA
jgi:hypothetical protein